MLAQSHAATHRMIADGHPQAAVEGWDVRHHRASHGWTGRKTLFYEWRWERHLRAMGWTPPADAHAMDLAVLHAYSSKTMLDRLGFDPFPPRTSGADTPSPG